MESGSSGCTFISNYLVYDDDDDDGDDDDNNDDIEMFLRNG